MNSDCSLIVIPAYNEASQISSVLTSLQSTLSDAGTHCRIVVFDDCSTDQTPKIAERCGVQVVRSNRRNGYHGVIRNAIEWGIRYGYRNIVLHDADGQHGPENPLLILRELQTYDIVVASRGRPHCTLGPTKLFVQSLYRFFLRRGIGLTVMDPTSGSRGFGDMALSAYSKHRCPGFLSELGPFILADRENLRVGQVTGVFFTAQRTSRIYSQPFGAVCIVIQTICTAVRARNEGAKL